MNTFYKNDFLDILKENKEKHCFKLLSKDVSIIIIFNSDNIAKCLITESYSKEEYFSEEEKDSIYIARQIENKLSIPSFFIKYSQEELDTDSEVIFNKTNLKQISKLKLKDIFQEINKETEINFEIVNTKKVKKEINDKFSTPFHKWQRDYLKYNGFPVDLDLAYSSNENNNIKLNAIVELKRSYITNWLPYKNDIKNYLALSKFSDNMEIDFLLIFIQQIKNNEEVYDDYNQIYIYNIFHKIGKYKEDSILFSLKDYLSLEELLNKNFNLLKTKPLKNISM